MTGTSIRISHSSPRGVVDSLNGPEFSLASEKIHSMMPYDAIDSENNYINHEDNDTSDSASSYSTDDGRRSQQEYAAETIRHSLTMNNDALQISHSKLTPEDLGLLGVSVSYLLNNFLADVRNAGFDETANIYEIEEDVIRKKGEGVECPVDKNVGAAYVHCLTDTDNVGHATVMLSYAWDYTIGDIVDTLIEYCSTNDLNPKTTYVWICCLCINQHRVLEQRSRGEVVQLEKFRSVFEGRVTKIGHVFAMMAPWQAPTYLTRIWCVYELYMANETNCVVTLGMPSRDRKDFIDAMRGNDGADKMNKLFTMLGNTDVRKTEASTVYDRSQILSLILKGPGYDKFNVRVNELVRKWAIGIVLGEVEAGTGGRQDETFKARHGTLLNNVGGLFDYIGGYKVTDMLKDNEEYDEALKLYERTLGFEEKLFGRQHENTADTIHSIALILNKMGERRKSLKLHREVLGIRQMVLGKEHEDTANSLSLVANMLKDKGEYDEALKLFKEALYIEEKMFGRQHENTADTIHSIASVLHKKGEKEESLKMQREVLAICQNVLGKEHERTANSLCLVANMLKDEGEYDEALKLYKEALYIEEKLFGRQHEIVADIISSIALVLDKKGEKEESLMMHRKALVISQKVSGKDHKRTANFLTLVANTLGDEGKYDEALHLYEEALSIEEKVLGRQHINTARTICKIAYIKWYYQTV